MLDAIAQTLAEQAAKPAAPATVKTAEASLVAPQRTIVPAPKPTISAPESLSPSFLPQLTRDASTAPATAAKTLAPTTSNTDTVKETPAASSLSERTPSPTRNAQIVDVATSKATEQATATQRQVLKQRLADIVGRERLLKEAKLRASLEATAIATAQAGQFLQARRMAQEQMLSPASQAALLAQIDAIEAAKAPTTPVLALKRALPPLPVKLKPWTPATSGRSLTSVVKPWTPATTGRSLPSVLPYTPPQESTSYTYVPTAPSQYVSYSFNGFGRAIGGFGVIVDSNTPAFDGQSWTTASTAGNRYNAELWNGLSFIFPLAVPAPITSGFGWRVHPIRGDRRFHKGTDIGAPMGTPVLAAADGKVALADQLNGYGLTVILSHQSDTRETLYAHLSAMLVKPGQWVEKGTVIGRVGSTGLSTGPHLHFELRQKTASGWQAIDPGAQLKYALARLVKAMQSG